MSVLTGTLKIKIFRFVKSVTQNVKLVIFQMIFVPLAPITKEEVKILLIVILKMDTMMMKMESMKSLKSVYTNAKLVLMGIVVILV